MHAFHETCRRKRRARRSSATRRTPASLTSLPRLSVRTAKPNSSSASAECALASTAHPRPDRFAHQRRGERGAVGVERRERLVEQQHVGPRQHRARDRKALLHPARKPAHAGVGGGAKRDPLQPFGGRRADLRDAIELA